MNQEIEKMLRAWVTYAQTNLGDLLLVVTTRLAYPDIISAILLYPI
jgi:hypothetical protein